MAPRAPVLLLLAAALLALAAPALGWITVSPTGNMTLMTHAQVGDWTHDTTGPAKDMYVTGNVFVGKERGKVSVSGDMYLQNGLYAERAVFKQSIQTAVVTSKGITTALQTGFDLQVSRHAPLRHFCCRRRRSTPPRCLLLRRAPR